MNILNWPNTLTVSTRTFALTAFLALLACANTPLARADLIASPYLPLTLDQWGSSNAGFGGTQDCTTGGTYNAATTAFTQSGACTDTSMRIGGVTVATGVSLEASLIATVDNFGQVVGGTFSLFGIVDDLGIIGSTLLASGTLLDAHYGTGPIFFSQYVQALIELDYVDVSLGDLGDLMLWDSFAEIVPWTPGQHEWQVDVNTSDYAHFTGSEYRFYDRALIPEPGTLALGCIGLVLFRMAKRQRTV